MFSTHQILQARAFHLRSVVDAKLSHVLHQHLFAGDTSGTVWILRAKSGLIAEANARVNLRVALFHTENCIMRIEDHDLVEHPSLWSKLLEELVGFDAGGAHPHVHRHHLVRGQIPGQFHHHLDLWSLHSFYETSTVFFGNEHRWNVNSISIAIVSHNDVGQALCSEVRILSVNDDYSMCIFCILSYPDLVGERAIPTSNHHNVDEPYLVVATFTCFHETQWRDFVVVLGAMMVPC
mmetsp:Transcript_44784/g.97333  ORF Transcript_44784/g.97333 Transcript_44784/m.97333 type:complete len:236 (-) Transcript_44784:261-968(-)